MIMLERIIVMLGDGRKENSSNYYAGLLKLFTRLVSDLFWQKR